MTEPKKPRRRAGLDIDGVLYQWSATARFLLSEYRGKTVTESKEWDHIKKNVSPDDWRWLWSTGIKLGLFRHGNLVRGAAEFIRKVEREFDLVFITSRPEEVRQDTIDWLSFHRFPATELHVVGREANKGRVTKPCDFFIEDKPENALDYKYANPESLVLLWTAPWNMAFRESMFPETPIVRVFEFSDAWDQIEQRILRGRAPDSITDTIPSIK